MKARHLSVGPRALAVLLVTLLSLTFPVASAPPVPTAGASLPSVDPIRSAEDYLIALSILPPEPADVLAHLAPEQALAHARGLTQRQAQPVLPELERLRAEGRIEGFEVRPDLHGVVVTGAVPAALDQLSRVGDIGAVMAYADEPPACAVAAAEALPEQVLGLSHARAEQPKQAQAAGAIQTTNPSILVYAPPGSTWTSVSGQTTANITVGVRILRGGRLLHSGSTTSNSYGNYYFYPIWQSCPTSGYNWSLRPGDVVEVTARGNTVTTVVAELSAWVDPTDNTVTGKTEAGRAVDIRVYAPGEDLCQWYSHEESTNTDATGRFTIDFTGQLDFDRSASAVTYARDANGNSTYAWFYAYRITAQFDSQSFWGYLKPAVDFTATLRRGGNPIASYVGESSPGNYYRGWFTETIQSGDVIAVNGGGITMEFAVSGLDIELDYVGDRLTGELVPGRRVQASFYKNYYGWRVRTSCSWAYDCVSDTADAAGSFTITTALDLARGDYAYVYAYDAEGNYQYSGPRYVPAVVADIGYDTVAGHWGEAYVYVTVVVKDSEGEVKATRSDVSTYYDGGFSTWLGVTLSPGDRIDVGDGVITETMTVQNLTARLSGSTGELSGNAPDSSLLATFRDFRRDQLYWQSACEQTDVSGGSYGLTFSGAQVGAQDYATVWSTGPDGHYTSRTAHTFSVNAQKEGTYVYGLSETPSAPVTITLARDGSPIATASTTSGNTGYYYVYLSQGTTQGDTIHVETGDGSVAMVPIPELTVSVDVGGNRLYGLSPANEWVRPYVRRHTSSWTSRYSQMTRASGAGSYSTTFNHLYWWRNCSPVHVGHRCSEPAVAYYNEADHQVFLWGGAPSPAPPDAYESDDTPATASTYDGVQTHTFHATDDVDWVKFQVPHGDVNAEVPYRINTSNLGWYMATEVVLYNEAMEELGRWIGYEYDGRGVSASWTPTAAGLHYLRISPPFSYYAEYCDAYYDLMILPMRAGIYLPLVARGQ